MQTHSGHWSTWAGFRLRWMALLSSCLIFVWFPVTRDGPWANLLLLGIAAALVLMGVRRACAPERPRRATSAGVALATLSVAMCGGFVCATVMLARRLLASHRAPQMGQKAPDFRLSETHGTLVSLAELLAAPVKGRVPKGVLLVFYAGVWWPSCNSELRSIHKHLEQLAAVGMRPVAISVDAPESSRTLCQKAGDTSTFLADPHAGVMRRYDLVHAGAGIKGQDSARPGECWVDVSGTVRGVNLTDNSWVRARPDQMLAVAQALR